MLQSPSQYSQQGFMPQFAGLPAPGMPQTGPGLFGQPGAYGGNGQQYPFGAQQYPFAGQQNPFQQNPFTQNPYLHNQMNPYLQNQLPTSPFAHNPLLAAAGAPHLAHQIVQSLEQLAQQILVQSALTQQIGVAIQQLAQATQQSLHAHQSLGTGQALGLGGQPFGQSPFAIPSQAGYGSIGTPAQAWSSNRPTIQ